MANAEDTKILTDMVRSILIQSYKASGIALTQSEIAEKTARGAYEYVILLGRINSGSSIDWAQFAPKAGL